MDSGTGKGGQRGGGGGGGGGGWRAKALERRKALFSSNTASCLVCGADVAVDAQKCSACGSARAGAAKQNTKAAEEAARMREERLMNTKTKEQQQPPHVQTAAARIPGMRRPVENRGLAGEIGASAAAAVRASGNAAQPGGGGGGSGDDDGTNRGAADALRARLGGGGGGSGVNRGAADALRARLGGGGSSSGGGGGSGVNRGAADALRARLGGGGGGTAQPSSTFSALAALAPKAKDQQQQQQERTTMFDGPTVQDMMAEERLGKATGRGAFADADAAMAKHLGAKRRFAGVGGDDRDLQDDADAYAAEIEDGSDGRKKKQQKSAGIAAGSGGKPQFGAAARISKCPYCRTSPAFDARLLLSESAHALLMVPPLAGPGCKDHMQIIPREHENSLRTVSEDAETEVRNFKKSIIKYYLSKGYAGALFIETALLRGSGGGAGAAMTGLGDASKLLGRHGVLDAVPLPSAIEGDDGALDLVEALMTRFRLEFTNAESEWAQNRKHACVDVVKGGGLRHVIPPNFAYVHVEANASKGGLLHVVEDVEEWPQSFALEVYGGVCGHDPNRWHAHATAERRAAARGAPPTQALLATAANLRSSFSRFDWVEATKES